jgi:NAD-dependent dihydropyrimidine dehydrogenase PreA subunit
MPKLTVVISQGQSASPDKRGLEEALVGALLMERGVEVTVVPHLYDLAPGSTGMLCLEGIQGDMVVASWLFPRAAHWTLDRGGIKGHMGKTLLESEADEDDGDIDEDEDETDEAQEEGDDKERVGGRDVPNRTIYHLHLSAHKSAEPLVAEIKRIASEASVKTVDLMGWIGGSPKPEQLARYLEPRKNNGQAAAAGADAKPPADGPAVESENGAAGAVVRVDQTPARRWYPVIDYSRCTNCMECIDFCLFGVYGVDGAETILVEQPDNCRKGCPACSRVCPENAIIFPQHKTPAIAGSSIENAGGLKIDLSILFGAPNAIEIAAQERDVELVAVGRDAVGLSVGIPKRQADKPAEPKDDLDKLMDQLDEVDL